LINSAIGVGTSLGASGLIVFLLSDDEKNVPNGEEMINPDALEAPYAVRNAVWITHIVRQGWSAHREARKQ